MLLASPVIFWQIWRFVAPGLYQHEQRILLPFTALFAVCFLGGAAFGYYLVFPLAFEFLVGYGHEALVAMPGASEYFSLALRLFIAFGVVFELPVLMVMLAKLGVVDADFLKKQRRYAILLIFVLAAILTPPDVVSQLLMAGPLIILYEISIIMVQSFIPKKAGD